MLLRQDDNEATWLLNQDDGDQHSHWRIGIGLATVRAKKVSSKTAPVTPNPSKPELNTSDATEAYAIKWLNSLEEVIASASLWRALDATSPISQRWFQSYEWCRNWLETHGEGRGQPRILVLLKGASAVAICPMMIQKGRLGLSNLRILGEPHTQYANMVTAEAALSELEIALIREAIAGLPGLDTAVFPLVPQGSPLAQLLGGGTAVPALANESIQISITPDSGKDFWQRFGGRTKKSYRRKERRLQELGPERFLTLRPGMPLYRDMVDHCVAMKKRWLQETGQLGRGMAASNHDRFLAALATTGDGTDGPVLFALCYGERPVAIEIGFRQGTSFLSYMGAFDWDVRSHSPGTLLMARSIESLARSGITSYDLLANPADYKKELGTQSIALTGHAITFTPRGSLYTHVWTKRLRPLAGVVYKQMPMGLRGALVAHMRKGMTLCV